MGALKKFVGLVVLGCALSSVRCRAIAEYEDASNYDEMIEKDNLLLKNLDEAFETAIKEERDKVKRSDESDDPKDSIEKETKSYNDSDFDLALGDNGVDEDGVSMDEEDKEKDADKRCCNDLSYLKTFPPCCGTTCCQCQETCPGRGYKSPLPGSCSM